MQRYAVSASASVFLLLGACAGQPEAPDETRSYATASPNAETVAQIRAEAKTDPVVTETAMANADEVVCVREASTNSYLRVRRCYTRTQLDGQASRTQQQLSDAMSRTVREVEAAQPPAD